MRVGGVEALVHDLRGARPIEDERGRAAEGARGVEHLARDVRRGSRWRISVSPSRVFTSAPPLTMSVSGASICVDDRPARSRSGAR